MKRCLIEHLDDDFQGSNAKIPKYEDCVRIFLDLNISSDLLKTKTQFDSFLIKTFSSEEYSFMIEEFGHVILKDDQIVKILSKLKGRKYWGENMHWVMVNTLISKVPLDWRGNKELVLASTHDDCFQYLSDELKNDREVVLHLLRHGQLMEGIPDHFLNDKQFILDAVRKNFLIFDSLSECWRNDREVVFKTVENTVAYHLPALFDRISSSFFNDREFALFALRSIEQRKVDQGSAKDLFTRLSSELKSDPYILLAGFKLGCCPYSNIIEKRMQDDLELTRNAYYLNNLHLKVPEKFKSDGRVILKYLISEKNTNILKYLTEDLKKNKRFFLDAIQKCDETNNPYDFASDELKRDHDVSIAAISRVPKLLDKIPIELKDDKKFVLRLLKVVKPNKVFSIIPNELKSDQDVMMQAIIESPEIIKYSELKNNKTFIMKALNFKPELLKFVPNELKDDREVVLVAIKKDGQSIFHSSKNFRNDRELILLAASNSIKVLDEYSNLSDDPEVIELLICNNPSLLQSRKYKHLAKDEDFILKVASKGRKRCFDYLDAKLKSNKAFMLQYVKYDGFTFQYPKNLDKDIVRETLKVGNITTNVVSIAARAPFIDEQFLLESCRYNMKCFIMTRRKKVFAKESFLESLVLENLRFKLLEKGDYASEGNNSERNSYVANPTFSFQSADDNQQESLLTKLTNLNNQFNNLNMNNSTHSTLNLPINLPGFGFPTATIDSSVTKSNDSNGFTMKFPTHKFPSFKLVSKSDDNRNQLQLISLTAMPEYKDRSFEEWRWLYHLALNDNLNFDPFKENGIKVDSNQLFNNWNAYESNPISNAKPATTGFNFSSPTSQINAGMMHIIHPYSLEKEFSDLDIDIYENDKLFATIDTLRVVVGKKSKVLSNMIKTQCKRRNDKYVLELNTSVFDVRLGNITGSLLYTAIKSMITSVNVHVDDFLRVFLIMDFYEGSTNTLSGAISSAIRSQESVARSFIKSFGGSFLNISQTKNILILLDIFKEAFKAIMNGKDLANEAIFSSMSKELFYEGLLHSDCKEITRLLKVIDCWASSNLDSSQDSFFILCKLLEVFPHVQPMAMINILSSKPSCYNFVNNLSLDYKLQLINKYACSLAIH